MRLPSALSKPAAILVLMVLIGGMNGVGVRVIVGELAPLWAASLRFLFAGAILAAVVAMRGIPIPRGASLLGALLYGVFGFGLNYAFGYRALQDLSAGTAQVVTGVVPLLTIGVASLVGQERLSGAAIVGAAIAAVGIGVVGLDAFSRDAPISALLLAVASALSIAISTVILKGTPRVNPVSTNAVGMLVGASGLLVASVLSDETWSAPTSPGAWLALVFLVLGGSVAVFALQVMLVRLWPASSAAYGFLLLPLATITYGAIVLDEHLTATVAIGAAIALAGVYLGAFRNRRRPVPDAVPTV